MHKRSRDQRRNALRDYKGENYYFRSGIISTVAVVRGRLSLSRATDQNIEYHLALDNLRPIFVRVLLDCLVRR